MKIAVVGGNGFIGSEFVKFASERGHDTVVIGSDCDVFDDKGEKQVNNTLETCEAMVFLAAKRFKANFSAQDDYIYNIKLAEKYLRLASETLVENVVLTSSRSVYSGINTPWKEDEFQTPLSLYGASKQATDSLALLYNKERGMKIKSLRLAQVIGIDERKGYLLNTLIDNAIAGKKQTICGKGTGKRQYIYVKDVCDAILHSATVKKEMSGVFNIGMDFNVSIIELAETINEVFENEAGIEMLTDKPEDAKEYLMDVSKAERELCWKPRYDLRDAFEDLKKNIV